MAAALAGDDLARQSSSRRSWRSTSVREMWNAPDVFQRSGRQQAVDEEEELKWAAIERLPTYDRMRRGMLRQAMSNGRVITEEVDVANLGAQDKKQLMESILKVVEEDNERFLQRLRARNDRVGIEVPKVEVRFQNVSIEGDAYVGTRALPTLLNSTLNQLEGLIGLIGLSPSKKRVVKILQDVSGIIKPSRMTLLLGPPSSGKTTLLKALAGKLDKDLRMALSLFRFIAALGRSEVVSGTIGSFTLLLVFVLGGFVVAKDDILPWMIWGYYVSPMMYGQNAIAINEFLDKRWSSHVNGTIDDTVGKVLLRERGLFTTETWYWICVGALLGFSLLFNVLFIGALTFLDPLSETKTLIENDDDSESRKRRQSNQKLFLMKRGGQVIYAGPLGRQSHKLVEYFEAIPGVSKIKEGYNPATWMLEVSSASIEAQNDVDFAEIFANSDLYSNASAVQSVVAVERTVFYRERAAGNVFRVAVCICSGGY
ncbi:hypothetical protein GBA52_027195 [Prunus armeniaca]|nr:hypothetical protein GBA52_027195 [Prunus armeniaca]